MNSFQKQLNKISSSFDSTLKQLDLLISSTQKEQEYKTSLIEQLTIDNSDLEETKNKATRIKNNIEKLLDK
jgi:hypothetical protein